MPKEYTDSLRLRQKYKREFKSTSRALILDNQFLAREELRQQMEKYFSIEFHSVVYKDIYFFLRLEILNENEKSKIFTHNYQCKKENIEKCTKPINCYCFSFLKNKRINICFCFVNFFFSFCR
jgi:hypothetical protein